MKADGEQALWVDGLSFSYPDGRRALRAATFSLSYGEKVGLVGPNGAGKSTLLLHLNGLLRGEGRITVDGMSLDDASVRTVRGRVGLVFQDPDDQLFSPSVFDDVAFGPLYMGLTEPELTQRVQHALEQVGMAAYAGRLPHHLSLGEKKRVALATVLSMDPAILALDEPSAGLDPEARLQLIELLRALPATMLIATHDLDLVSAVCSRALVLVDGTLRADLAPENITLDLLRSTGARL